jgi:hypothetical protein
LQERASRRVLVVVGIVLVVLLVAADLLRRDSIIRSTWRGLNQSPTPIERLLRPFRGAQLPDGSGHSGALPVPGGLRRA